MGKGSGVILAGGKATRLGGISKADIMIGDKNCLARAHNVLARGLDNIAVSGHIETPYKMLTDWPDKGRGGVAFAVLGALDWAQKSGFDFIITLPVDAPFVPLSFTHLLMAEFKTNSRATIAFKSNERVQGLHALWPTACLGDLKSLILEEDICKISALHERLGGRYVHFPKTALDPFFNLNTQADIDKARRLLSI